MLGFAGAVGAGTAIGCASSGDEASAPGDDFFTCLDTSGLKESDITMRSSLQYTDTSPEEGKNCANCSLYVAPEAGTGCGTCKTVKGPVHPLGYCTIWAAMTG